MAVSAKDVKELREITGAGMMDCKKALTEAGGDMEKAQELLREKGLAAAAKKAGRIAAEGIVASYIGGEDKVGVLLEVNCETDFVAKTPEFKDFVTDIAEQIAKTDPDCVGGGEEECANPLLSQEFFKDPSMTIQDYVNEKISKIGEKISVRRFTRFDMGNECGIIESYIHGDGKIGVLVEVACDSADVAKSGGFREMVHDLAMHVAAANPRYLSDADIDPDVLAKEEEILTVQAKNEGKPEKIVANMVKGRIKKFKMEICLLDQEFVKDPDVSILQFVDAKAKELGAKIQVVRFARYEMGEGLEKRQDDFASEVAAQASGK